MQQVKDSQSRSYPHLLLVVSRVSFQSFPQDVNLALVADGDFGLQA